jgi:hypothetical protein
MEKKDTDLIPSEVGSNKLTLIRQTVYCLPLMVIFSYTFLLNS